MYVFQYLYLLLFPVSAVLASTCYHVNGEAIPNPAYQPCNSIGGAHSMCCGLNPGNGVPQNQIDICLPNGLCYSPASRTYWRDSCTDPGWLSPNCLNVCSSGPNGTIGEVQLTLCPVDGKWCCGAMSATDCCTQSARFAIQATIGASTSTSLSAPGQASSTKSPTATTSASTSISMTFGSPTTSMTYATSTSSTTSASNTAPSGPSSTSEPPAATPNIGTYIGIGVGVGAGVVLLAAVGLFFFLRRRKDQRYELGRTNATTAELESSRKTLAPLGSSHQGAGGYKYDPGQAPAELAASHPG